MIKAAESTVNLITQYEKLHQIGTDGLVYPYLDSSGIPTIGIGTIRYEDDTKVSLSDRPITQEKARELFLNHLRGLEVSVNLLVLRPINQNQADAILSFMYNCGVNGFASSTLLKRINNNPSDPTIRDAFLMWVKAADPKTGELVTVPGLVNRRTLEANLYFSL